MTEDQDLITRKIVTTTRMHLAGIETSLMNVSGHITPLQDPPALGLADMHYLTLGHARSHLWMLKSEQLEAIAGPDAAAALLGYQGSFRRMDEVYGIVCGPDRTAPARDALHESLRTIASSALRHLTVYAAQTKALVEPDHEAYLAALKRQRPRLKAQKRPTASSPIPRVPSVPHREDIARRSRIALGIAFGGLGGVYLTMMQPPTKYAGMISLMRLSMIVENVGARASALVHRCPGEHSVFADHAQGISDGLDALFHQFETAIVEREIDPADVRTLAEEIKPVIGRVGEAIRIVERLTGESI